MSKVYWENRFTCNGGGGGIKYFVDSSRSKCFKDSRIKKETTWWDEEVDGVVKKKRRECV